jgi:hypothetical protein
MEKVRIRKSAPAGWICALPAGTFLSIEQTIDKPSLLPLIRESPVENKE